MIPGKDVYVLPKDKHAWAFYYYLKRCGDTVTVEVRKDTLIIYLEERNKQSD